MTQQVIMAKMTAAAGKRDELMNVLGSLVDAVQDEPGTITFVMHASKADDVTVIFYEIYADEAALKAHQGNPALAGIGPKMAGLVDGRPEIIYLDVIKGKGLPG